MIFSNIFSNISLFRKELISYKNHTKVNDRVITNSIRNIAMHGNVLFVMCQREYKIKIRNSNSQIVAVTFLLD